MDKRFQSLQEFWPYYIAEHKNTSSRKLHFLGTSGFIASAALSTVLNPVGMSAALAGMFMVGRHAVKTERKTRSIKHALAIIAMPTIASPVLIPAGVVFAYGCAWVGHFKFEHNRPATFDYPVMSLTSDFKMYGHMLRGKLWGDADPVEELGLDEPVIIDDVIEPETEPAYAAS